MESTSFYITLPSSTRKSDELFINNTASCYKIQLPKEIYLQNKYEVALTEITYPHTWPTFNDAEQYSFTFIHSDDYLLDNMPDSRNFTIPIDQGHYLSIKDLLEKMNDAFQEQREDAPYVHHLRFSFNNISQRVKIFMKDDKGSLMLSSGLCDVLGFERGQYFNETITAPYAADITRGFNALYVYCDLCEPQIVGDTFAPLLRTVFLSGKPGEMVNTIFDPPHYVPISINKKFQTVEIDIKNDVDENISFETGKVICKLHFRQKAL